MIVHEIECLKWTQADPCICVGLHLYAVRIGVYTPSRLDAAMDRIITRLVEKGFLDDSDMPSPPSVPET